MSRGPHRTPAQGRTKAQHLCLVAAASGKLFKIARPYSLILQHANGEFRMVHTFGKQAVKQCEKAGWIDNHDQGDGRFRIMTTHAGDRELARPLRIVKPRGLGLDADWRREALR